MMPLLPLPRNDVRHDTYKLHFIQGTTAIRDGILDTGEQLSDAMSSVLNCTSPPIKQAAGLMQMVDRDECCNALTERNTRAKELGKSKRDVVSARNCTPRHTSMWRTSH